MTKSSLGPVRPAHRFDEAALDRYLRAHISEISNKINILQFDAGQSNPTFVIESGSRRWVLRKKPPGALLPKAHMIEREHRVMAALADTGVPVPRMHHLCADPSVIGTAFFVMEYVPGRVFWDGAFPDYSPDERRALYAELIRVLAALHRVDPERVGLGDFGRPGNYFARQISRWTRQYRAAETERIESMERLIEWLPANIPDDDATAIVHGDYRLDNLIFCADEPRIAAVLDWELSTLGHPLADVAYQCMLYHIDAPSHACLASTAGGDSGIPTEAEYIAAYCQRAGREGGVAAWPFYLAFALFRFASILQGVYRRGLDGNASSTTALSRGAQARGSADAAWALIY